MALDDVLRALEAEAHARCAEIRENAQRHAERSAEEARCRCEELVRERLDAHEGAVAVRTHRMVSDARMESRHELAAERDRLIADLFASAEEALGKVRETDGYEATLDRLLGEALESAVQPSSVLCDPADVKRVEALLARRGAAVPVRGEISTGAGVIVLSHDDRVAHENTAEARLARVRELSRDRLGEMLFG